MINLTNKNALVTGASGGIGRQIALDLAKQGAKIVISGTNQEKLEKTKNQITSEIPNSEIHILTCNLSDVSAVKSLFAKSEEILGQIDILVCNAGITKDNLILRMTEEEFDNVISVNLKSCFILNQEAVKKMISRRNGRIINISSIVGTTGNPGQANYAASKAGMIGMSKSMAAEVAGRNVTINVVSPGFIDTEMTQILTEAQKEKILQKIPMKRMGSAKDISASVCFLASDEASYITGQTIHVNGGMLMV